MGKDSLGSYQEELFRGLYLSHSRAAHVTSVDVGWSKCGESKWEPPLYQQATYLARFWEGMPKVAKAARERGILVIPVGRNTAYWFFPLILLTLYWAWFQWAEYNNRGITYTGTVISKIAPTGRRTAFLMVVNWDGIGVQAINSGPTDFSMYEIGDRYATRLSYTPFLGRSGYAYAPNDRSTQANPIVSVIMMVWTLALGLCVLVGVIWCYRELIKAIYRRFE